MCYFLWTLNTGKKTEETEEVQLQKKSLFLLRHRWHIYFSRWFTKSLRILKKNLQRGGKCWLTTGDTVYETIKGKKQEHPCFSVSKIWRRQHTFIRVRNKIIFFIRLWNISENYHNTVLICLSGAIYSTIYMTPMCHKAVFNAQIILPKAVVYLA